MAKSKAKISPAKAKQAVRKASAPAPQVQKKPMVTKQQVLKGAAIAGGVGLAAFGAVKGVKALQNRFGKRRRRSSVTMLKNQVLRKALKIKNIQLDRKLLREQLRL